MNGVTAAARPFLSVDELLAVGMLINENFSFDAALIAPLMPPLGTTGRTSTTSLRDVFDAILYLATTGCQWRMMPRLPAGFHNPGLFPR